jgi:Tol biopolymer transport system component
MRLSARLGAVLAATVGLVTMFETAVPAHATFTGRNGRIAYILDKGTGSQIYTIKPDGTGRRQLTHVDGAAVSPDWSPDGRKIVFELDQPNDAGCSIELMDADGSHLTDLTGTGHPCDVTPAFMPTGHRVVFIAQGGDGPIMSMNLRGGDRRVIFRGRGLYKKRPQVSPDQTTIIFMVEKDLPSVGTNVKALYSVRLNGTDFKPVLPFDFDVCACGGDWAPSGRRVVSSDNAGADGPQTRPTNVVTVRPDGSGLRFVTHFQSIDVYVGSGSYSPDGRWILFKTIRNQMYALWKVHPDGKDKTLIFRSNVDIRSRDWGPVST